MIKVSELKKAMSELQKQLNEQGEYEAEFLKMCAEKERPKNEEDQKKLDKIHKDLGEIAKQNSKNKDFNKDVMEKFCPKRTQ